jgi:hypothetical protein
VITDAALFTTPAVLGIVFVAGMFFEQSAWLSLLQMLQIVITYSGCVGFDM